MNGESKLLSPVFIIVEKTEQGLKPLWQGGRTTSHAVRSFDDEGAARKSLQYLRGQKGYGSELKILNMTDFTIIKD